MASSLMVTISGIRGIIGESFTPSVVIKYVTAFGMLQKGKTIIVGRDSRISGPWILQIVYGVLSSLGYQVIDIGIVPTPTVQFMVKKHNVDGGIVITSSHNPIQWNGLKFVEKGEGLFISPEKCEQLFALADSGKFEYAPYNQFGSISELKTAKEEHIHHTLSLPYINVSQVREKKYKVVLDSVNGAGGPIMESLLNQLGCTVIGMNLEPTGIFAHMPEPIPEHLGTLCEAVKEHNADLGIAVDPDVDRCVLIDDTGKPLGEEYTLALAVKFYLKYVKKTSVCKNLSSSRAVDDICKEYGCQCFAAAVGEINVAKKMTETGSLIGGEGNGGVMLGDSHIGRDAIVAATLTLQHLCLFGGSISALKQTLPQYNIIKLKAPISGINPDAVVEHFRKEWNGKGDLNTEDGLHINTAEWWVHLRKSNTEPIIRVIGEAKEGSSVSSLEICTKFMNEILHISKR